MTPEQRKQAEEILELHYKNHKKRIPFYDNVYKAMEAFASLCDAEEKRMPTDKEGQMISFKRYPDHGKDPDQQKKQAAFFLGWRMCLDELRSRMTRGGSEKPDNHMEGEWRNEADNKI